MRYEEIIGKVRERAALPSDAAAEQALNATLAVLGERVGGDAGMSVASQLPEQLAAYVRREAAATGSPDEPFGADDFVERVSTRADATSGDTERVVVATLGVISEATGGALDELRYDLPPDYDPLFIEVQGAPGRL